MKIIVVTYPVSPYRGSEFAVSWNYIVNMSKYHELFVLYGTSGNGFGNVSELQDWLKSHELPNVHFIDVQVPKNSLSKFLAFCRKINYTYGSYVQYKYYYSLVYERVKDIIFRERIDIVHYLNPIGFKEPGKCWKINNVPYIWGPIKGVDNRPFVLYKALSFKGKINSFIKFLLHNFLFLTLPTLKKALKRADYVFSAVPRTVVLLEKYYQKASIYLPENGILKMEKDKPIEYISLQTFNIIWIGRIDENKALILLLEALKIVYKRNWHLHIVGSGYLERKLKEKFKCFGSQITWYGNVPRTKVMSLLSSMHLHVITSLAEATTTVLFEAMSYGIPTMTLDHCGMAGVVCEKCGIKIPIHSYKQVISDMAKHIDELIENPGKIQQLSQGVLECSKKYMWENRVKVFNEVYEKAALKYKTSNPLG